jgi:hypothetical protein
MSELNPSFDTWITTVLPPVRIFTIAPSPADNATGVVNVFSLVMAFDCGDGLIQFLPAPDAQFEF